MQNDLLFTSLQSTGLDDLSCKIYLELSQNENLTVSDLAKRFNVQRNKIYNCLQRLEEKDLVIKSSSYSRQLLINPPTKIIPILQQKEYSLKSNLDGLSQILPDLMKNYYDKKNEFVKVYKGRQQLMYLFDLILEENKNQEILAIGDIQGLMEFWGLEYELDWRNRRIEKDVKLRGLSFSGYDVNLANSKNNDELRELKFLPAKFKTDGLIVISGDQISQWNPILPRAIYIEDSVFGKMFRSFFEIMWELL